MSNIEDFKLPENATVVSKKTAADGPWLPETKYVVGDTVKPGNGFRYRLNVAYTSGTEPPLWPMHKGATVEGWQNIGSA